MMKNLYKGLAPAFFAMILFIFIRVANDVPMHRHYWDGNSLNFILIEVLPLILVSYPMMAIQLFWVKWCRKKEISRWKEYGFIILCTLFWGIVIMWSTRWMNGVTLNFYDTPIPIVIGILFVGFSYSFLRNQTIQKAYEVQRLQLEKIKNDQLQTELKFLKAQYHPHFLFNALNTVYFQIEEKNELPRRTLEILADLLRYQLYNDGDKVTIKAEIDYLQKYISLWKLRSTERLQLQVHFDDALQEQEICPLLFVPLVENAFKYVRGEYRITLDMYMKEDRLYFYVENTISDMLPSSQKKQGIGIENLKRRLELLYPDNYIMNIKKEKTLFKVELVLKL